MSEADEFVNQTVPGSGTNLDAQHLDVFVKAATHLLTAAGSAYPPTSASLVLAQPAIEVIINPFSAVSLWVSVAALNLTMGDGSGGRDNYVDLDNSGTYHITTGAIGFTPSAVASNAIRLYKATTNGSGAVTAIKPLAPARAVSPAMIGDAYGRQLSTAGIPTLSGGAGLGSGGTHTLAAGSTDEQGSVHITIGSTPSGTNTADLFTVTFSAPWGAPPAVVIAPDYSDLGYPPGALGLQVLNKSASAFSVSVPAAIAAGYAFAVDYIVKGSS